MHSSRTAVSKMIAAVIVVVVIVVAAGAAGYYYYYITPQQKTLTPVKVMLDFVPNGQELPFYVGVDKGFFAQNGLDVSILPGTGSGVATNAVASGQVQFADADTGIFLTTAHANNISNVRIISEYFQHNPNAVLFVNGRGVATPTDLEGKTIGASTGAPEALFDLFAHNAGVNVSKVHIITLTPTACPAALLSGKIDATTCLFSRGLVDLASQAKQQGVTLGSFNYSNYNMDFYGLGLITSTQEIQNQPQVVQAFVTGFWQAAQYAAKNPDQAVQSFMKYNSQANASLTLGEWKWAMTIIGPAILTAQNPTSAGYVDAARMAQTVNALSQVYGIPAMSSSSIYTNQFVQAPSS